MGAVVDPAAAAAHPAYVLSAGGAEQPRRQVVAAFSARLPEHIHIIICWQDISDRLRKDAYA
jgi:hypothetical protein